MDEQKVRKIIRDEIFKANNASRFNGVTSVVDHFHTGLDSPRINEDNIVNGTKNNSLIVMNTSETFQIKNIKNPSTLVFHGFAADNAGGGAATQRAKIDGTVMFGTCSRFSGDGSVISVDTATTTPFTQGCSSMYLLNQVDAVRVAADSEHFAYVTDGSSVVARAKVVAVAIDSITIEVELAGNWQITGAFLLT